MDTEDILPGMKLVLLRKDGRNHHTTVVEVQGDKIIIDASDATESFLGEIKKQTLDVHIVVNNTTYTWQEVSFRKKDNRYLLIVEGNPKVMNRRKYPRYPMSNTCEIRFPNKNHSVDGRMVNISAGGYAFKCMEPGLESMVGEPVELIIHDFELMKDEPLQASIIRCTVEQDVAIVGCRMLEDNDEIKAYVESRMGR